MVLVSYETLRAPSGVDVFIKGRRKPAMKVQKEIASALSGTQSRTRSNSVVSSIFIHMAGSILIFDTLNPLASDPALNLPTFLFSLINPQISLLAIYHLDIPLPLHVSLHYAPSPLTLLKYLATTIFTVHSLSHVLARKGASDRSLAEPVFGLSEEREGVIAGLGRNDPRGIVLEMEHRRKSGRGVEEWLFMPVSHSYLPANEKMKEKIILLGDHPLYRQHRLDGGTVGLSAGEDDTTFNLGLTEKQRRDREGVVLPYFDAQREGGGGGGRILYDMGVEDDFDEEEDEI